METKTITLRMRLRDYRLMRRSFPAMRNESAADYLERVALYMKIHWREEND